MKKRHHVNDRRCAPNSPHPTVLTPLQEAAIVAFRKHTLLPLDDCLYALKQIPQHARSSLHRCLQRHTISRLLQQEALQ